MSWNTIRFGDLYAEDSRNGLTKPSKVRGSGYKMINMGELFANDRIYDIPMELVPLKDSEKKNAKVEKGDLLFARQSLVLEGAGKCSIVLDVSSLTVFESHLIRVRLDKERANPLFYYYYFKSPLSPVSTIVSQCAQAGIRGSDLQELEIAFPALPIQNKIASALTKYDELIENNQRQIRLLEEAAKRLYKEWFIDLRFPGHEKTRIIDGIPEGWKKSPIGKMVKVVRGRSYSSKELSDIDSVLMDNLSNIRSYGGYNRNQEKHYNGKYNDEQVVETHDLLMGVTDMTQERRTVGRVALVPNLHTKAMISMDLIKLIPNESSTLFLYALLNYGGYSEVISRFANGTNVLHLRPDVLDIVDIVVPDAKIQGLFVDFFEKIQNRIDMLQDEIIVAGEARDRLLLKLMSREIEL